MASLGQLRPGLKQRKSSSRQPPINAGEIDDQGHRGSKVVEMESQENLRTGDPPVEHYELDDGSTQSPPTNEKDKANADLSAPPDGGIQAWLQVVSSFLIFYNVLGLLNAYGQFQTVYETDLLKDITSSTIAWIGSVQFFACYITCIFTGPVWDAGRLHLLIGSGTVIMVFGLMMLSLCKEFYQFFLAQAVVTGIGFGLVFMPASAIVSQWFSSKGPFAIGVATTGSSIGAVIYPIMLKELQPKIGFPWTVRVIAFMVLATQLAAFALMRMRIVPNTGKRKIVDLKHLKHGQYLLACIGFFVGFLGLYVFYYYIQLYAVQESHTPNDTAFYLLAILNAGSFFGRLAPNYIAGPMGPLNVQIICCLISGILSFCLLAIKTTKGVIGFTAIYGFFSGPFVTMPIPVTTSLSPDKTVLGTRLGMAFAFIGLGVLIGEPAAGAILGSNENWNGVIIWCGVMLVAGSFILVGARYAKVGPKIWAKA